MSALAFDGSAAGDAVTEPWKLAHSARRQLTPAQVELVDRLLEAGAAEAAERGYEGTTVRGVAKAAGIAAATAYTYFASKDHLLAEVLWRRMADLAAEPVPSGRSATDRVVAEVRLLGTFMAGEPELAQACTTALLGPGDDVRATRMRMGTAIHERLSAALGGKSDPAVLQSLELLYTGALLWMGMGHLPAERVPDALEEAARLLFDDGKRRGAR